MQYIDINNWNRHEHFLSFGESSVPMYSITTELDVTNLKSFTSQNSLSFYYSMIYLCTKAINRIENFKYRIRGNKVVLHDKTNPSFTYMNKNDELFKYVSCDYIEDMMRFCENCRKAAEAKHFYMDSAEDEARDDLIYFTCLPWFSFTAITHVYSVNKDDSIPRVAWGKYFESDGKLVISFNVQVNHRLVDGYHIGLLLNELNKEISALKCD